MKYTVGHKTDKMENIPASSDNALGKGKEGGYIL
jgi:hypothetical protein